jgi:hypothetical protein
MRAKWAIFRLCFIVFALLLIVFVRLQPEFFELSVGLQGDRFGRLGGLRSPDHWTLSQVVGEVEGGVPQGLRPASLLLLLRHG